MIEKHYSKFIPNMVAAMLACDRYEEKLGLGCNTPFNHANASYGQY